MAVQLHDSQPIKHPTCSTCGAPMWLIEVDFLNGPPRSELYRFECKACGFKAVERDDA